VPLLDVGVDELMGLEQLVSERRDPVDRLHHFFRREGEARRYLLHRHAAVLVEVRDHREEPLELRVRAARLRRGGRLPARGRLSGTGAP
jgi:hypothetical protein